MKSKFFFLFVFFMAIGAYTFAQSAAETAPAQKDATQKEVAVQKSTTGTAGQTVTMSQDDCKWVDANNDGICDTCGKTDCGKKSAKASTSSPADCPVKSSCKSSSSCCSSKGGKK